jgi:SAM-dependent methyltransferase/uncharacterized protein YbaR (Trm112 family)
MFTRNLWIGADVYEQLVDLLQCPACGGERLGLTKFSVEADRVIDGAVSCCSCKAIYPIIGGIPRFLPYELKNELMITHRSWFQKHGQLKGEDLRSNKSNSEGGTDIVEVQKTMRSFGYQWNTFDEMYPEWNKDFLNYVFPPVREDFFSGKFGLDAGCGMGRHIRVAAQYGAEMVGMDLSNAVEAAYRNTADLPNVHIVQGDISRPPFKEKVFDFVYSIGVLHHTPNPHRSFDALTVLPKQGAPLFIWVYSDTKHPVYKLFRRVSTRLPFDVLKSLSQGLAVASWVGFVLPYKLVRRLQFPNLSARMKFKRYADYPFRALYTDFFDELSAPIIHGHKEEEIRDWYSEANYRQIVTSSTDKLGWRGWGAR